MAFVLSLFLVFLISFIAILGIYVLLVANKIIKKKRAEKILKLIAIYSAVITLIYIYQYLYI